MLGLDCGIGSTRGQWNQRAWQHVIKELDAEEDSNDESRSMKLGGG